MRAIEPTLESFVAELRKSVGFFEQRYPGTPVSGILLSGFASVIPKLGEYIGHKTNIATVYADPWHGVSVSGDTEQLAAIRAEFAVAVGLAERGER